VIRVDHDSRFRGLACDNSRFYSPERQRQRNLETELDKTLEARRSSGLAHFSPSIHLFSSIPKGFPTRSIYDEDGVSRLPKALITLRMTFLPIEPMY
jgi:hypothetical protein